MIKKAILLLLLQFIDVCALDARCSSRCSRPCVVSHSVRVCRPVCAPMPWFTFGFGAPYVYEDLDYPCARYCRRAYAPPCRRSYRVVYDDACDDYDDYDECCEEVFV